MHIEEIIIDGFKSYAKRTVVQGFDPQFNAITGLNGSGKSNILDSICFVLGISKLEQVRAGSLQVCCACWSVLDWRRRSKSAPAHPPAGAVPRVRVMREMLADLHGIPPRHHFPPSMMARARASPHCA